MSTEDAGEHALKAVRCHDVTVSLGNKQVPEFDQLMAVGMAVRLALHLRGVPAVPYDLLKQVALHMLSIPPVALPTVVDVLAQVDFLKVDKQGTTIKSIVPTVPYYEDMFEGIGQFAEAQSLSEPEQLTLELISRLSKSPTPIQTIYNMGAEKGLTDRMINVGTQGGYIINKRARGRDMLISPMYFGENLDAFADLAAGAGASRVGRVTNLLAENQGWPLSIIKSTKKLGDQVLTDEELNIIISMAGDGFTQPPMIQTTHAGSNFFLFSPKPGLPRIGPTKRQIYENAMALVAAVRQGQLLPARYAIRSPIALLTALKERKFLGANSEAVEQYRAVATQRLGRLVKLQSDRYRFELIDTPENVQAVEMALKLVKGEEPVPNLEEDAVLAFRKGQTYIDSLVGRQKLVEQEKIQLDKDSLREIDDFMLGLNT